MKKLEEIKEDIVENISLKPETLNYFKTLILQHQDLEARIHRELSLIASSHTDLTDYNISLDETNSCIVLKIK